MSNSDDEAADNRDSSARQARRQRQQDKEQSKTSHESILIPASRRSTPVLLYPWGLGNFPIAYNDRLAEWRVRAGHSTHQEHWCNWREYQLAIIATALGFINVLYFPVFALSYGQGTYVFAFILTQVLVGFPLVLFELAIGQYTSADVVRVFSLYPLSEGVGLALLLKSIIRVVVFNFYLAWMVYYIYRSFSYVQFTPKFVWKAPWDDCFIEELDRHHLLQCAYMSEKLKNNTEFLCRASFFNDVALKSLPNCTALRRVVRQHDTSDLNWPLVCCLGVISIVTFLIILKGIRSIGCYVAWVVPALCVTLLILLLAVLCYKGALDGLLYLFTPEWRGFNVVDTQNGDLMPMQRPGLGVLRTSARWRYLALIILWFQMVVTVVIQVIQCQGLDTGGMIVVGSYADFQSLVHYHAIGACIAGIVVNLLTASIVFCLMGITSSVLSIDIYNLRAQDSLDLDLSLFTIMSFGVDKMWSPILWALLLFFVFAWILESAVICEILVFLKPIYGTIRLTEPRRHVINICAVVGIFLLTLPLTTKEGVVFYQLTFIHKQQYKYGTLFVAMFELAFITYGYGLKRLSQDIDFMAEFTVNTFIRIMWLTLPLICLALLIAAWIRESMLGSRDDGDNQERLVSWTVCVLVLLPIPVCAVWNIVSYSKKDAIKKLLRPRDESKWSRVYVTRDCAIQLQDTSRRVLTRAEALMEFLRTNNRVNKDREASRMASHHQTSTALTDVSEESSLVASASYRHHVSFSKSTDQPTSQASSGLRSASANYDSDGDDDKPVKKPRFGKMRRLF